MCGACGAGSGGWCAELLNTFATFPARLLMSRLPRCPASEEVVDHERAHGHVAQDFLSLVRSDGHIATHFRVGVVLMRQQDHRSQYFPAFVVIQQLLPTITPQMRAKLNVGITLCSLWSILTCAWVPKPRYWLSQKRVWEDEKQNSPLHGRKRK